MKITICEQRPAECGLYLSQKLKRVHRIIGSDNKD